MLWDLSRRPALALVLAPERHLSRPVPAEGRRLLIMPGTTSIPTEGQADPLEASPDVACGRRALELNMWGTSQDVVNFISKKS